MNRRQKVHSKKQSESSGFSEDVTERLVKTLRKSFRRDRSLENYLKLRSEFPSVNFGAGSVFDYFSTGYYTAWLNRFGVDTEAIVYALERTNPDVISKLSLGLLKNIADARQKKTAGGTHLARQELTIPDKLIDWSIVVMLELLGDAIPADLLVLARERLGGPNLGYQKGAEKQKKKSMAIFLANGMKGRGVEPTFSEIAREMGVSKSTISRLFAGPAEMRRLAARA